MDSVQNKFSSGDNKIYININCFKKTKQTNKNVFVFCLINIYADKSQMLIELIKGFLNLSLSLHFYSSVMNSIKVICSP